MLAVSASRPAGAKMVLVGDPKQLPEIDAGGLFTVLVHRLGCDELTENRRQRLPTERTANTPPRPTPSCSRCTAATSLTSTAEPALGDRVMTLRNNRRIGVLNGTLGTVIGSNGDDLVIATDDGRRRLTSDSLVGTTQAGPGLRVRWSW